MAQGIKTGDTVKVIAGMYKGETAKVVKIDKLANKAMLEGIGVRDRHLRANQYRQGGKKKIQLGIHLSNLQKTADGPARKIAKKSDDKAKVHKIAAKTAKSAARQATKATQKANKEDK